MKKAQFHLSAEMIAWIPRIILLISVTLIVVFIVRGHIIRTLDVHSTESHLLSTRLIYSPYCLAYKDVRVYPGIIDINKFTNERIKNCIKYEKDYKDFKVILENFNEEKISEISNADKIIDPALCEIESKDFKCYISKDLVLVKYADEIKRAIIKTVVMSYA